MPENDTKIYIEPIGVVKNPGFQTGAASGEKRKDDGWKKLDAEIVLEDQYADGLDDIEQHAHLIIVFWPHKMDMSDRKRRVKIHPQRRQDLPLTGVFSTSSPSRPNSTLVTVVKLINRVGKVLTVKGLDALDGTPVIDIKPYDPYYHAAD